MNDFVSCQMTGFCLRVPPPKPPSPSTATPYPHVMCVLSHHKWPSVFFEMLTMVEENVYGSSFLVGALCSEYTKHPLCAEFLRQPIRRCETVETTLVKSHVLSRSR